MIHPKIKSRCKPDKLDITLKPADCDTRMFVSIWSQKRSKVHFKDVPVCKNLAYLCTQLRSSREIPDTHDISLHLDGHTNTIHISSSSRLSIKDISLVSKRGNRVTFCYKVFATGSPPPLEDRTPLSLKLPEIGEEWANSFQDVFDMFPDNTGFNNPWDGDQIPVSPVFLNGPLFENP